MKRPTFNSAWAAAQRLYDPAHSGGRVSELVGGLVALNINSPDPRIRWSNTCAVRLSYVLNHSSMPVPRILGQTISGADKLWYFFRVKDVINFLYQRWGKPDQMVPYPISGSGPLADQKGLIVFEVAEWGDAAGHATLWNGHAVYDHCYFNEEGADYRADRASFWNLP